MVNSLYFARGMLFALQGTCGEFTLLFRRYVFLPFKGRVANSLYFSGGMFFCPSRDRR